MKKVFGFQVLINGKKICRAGFENETAIVTCILDSVRREKDNSEELNISISGLNSDTHQHANWFRNKLQEGDNVSIEIISNNFEVPDIMRRNRLKMRQRRANKCQGHHG